MGTKVKSVRVFFFFLMLCWSPVFSIEDTHGECCVSLLEKSRLRKCSQEMIMFEQRDV